MSFLKTKKYLDSLKSKKLFDETLVQFVPAEHRDMLDEVWRSGYTQLVCYKLKNDIQNVLYSELTFNCSVCGEEMSYKWAKMSYDKNGLIICDCCNTPTADDEEEYFAHLIETGTVILG